MTRSRHAAIAGISLCLFGSTAMAAVSLTGSSYSQDFNAFWGDLRTTTPITWTNDATVVPVDTGATTATLGGWYAYISGGSTQSAGAPTNVFRTNSFTSPQPIYLWRNSATTTDVALGSINFDGNSSSSGGYIAFGVALTNDTGSTIGGFMFSYDAEKWQSNYTANASNPVDTVSVSYAIGATGVADADGTWNSTSLGFSSTYPTAAGTANFTTTPASPSGSISGITWLPGETLFIRWRDPNISGLDRGVGIDNVLLTIPEPTSLAALVSLAFVALRRQKR